MYNTLIVFYLIIYITLYKLYSRASVVSDVDVVERDVNVSCKTLAVQALVLLENIIKQVHVQLL